VQGDGGHDLRIEGVGEASTVVTTDPAEYEDGDSITGDQSIGRLGERVGDAGGGLRTTIGERDRDDERERTVGAVAHAGETDGECIAAEAAACRREWLPSGINAGIPGGRMGCRLPCSSVISPGRCILLKFDWAT